MKNRIGGFDLLRAVSILYIISIWHIDDYANNLFNSPLSATLILSALSILVYMSAFLLATKYNTMATLKDVKSFLLKRFFRIYPLYIVAVLLFFLTSHISCRSFLSAIFLSNVLLNVNLLTLWFITMMSIYYFLMAIILYNYSIKRSVLIIAVFLVISVIMHEYFGLINPQLLFYLPSFILGLFCAKHNMFFQYVKSKTVVVITISFLAIATYISSYFVDGHCVKHIINSTIILVSIPPLVAFSEILTSKVDLKIFNKISYVSFCMYIYHRVIYWLLLKVYYPITNEMIILYLACLGLPLLYFISKLIQSKYDYYLDRVFSFTS